MRNLNNIHWLYTILLMLVYVPIGAQTKNVAIHIGDTIPDGQVQLLNAGLSTATLFDYRGKWLILDFWSTYCLACIGSFPKLEHLQQQYSDQLNLLLVVSDKPGTEQKYRDFLTMRASRHMPLGLPTVINDTQLVAWFPHKGLPHVVWIDPEGVVRAITGGPPLNTENVKALITGKVSTVNDIATDHIVNEEIEKPVIYRSQLWGFDPSSPGSDNTLILADSIRTHIIMANRFLPMMLLELFRRKFPDQFTTGIVADYADKQIIVKTSKPIRAIFDRFYRLRRGEISNDLVDYFSYEVVLPKIYDVPASLAIMLADLERVFQVQIAVEKRKVPVLNLVQTREVKLKTGFPTTRSFIEVLSENGKQHLSGTNISISTVVNTINTRFNFPFIKNGTMAEDSIDLDLYLSADATWADLNLEFGKYGLTLKPTIQELEVIVISDR
ncbi:Thiol-disulfide isomerase or thioredoxin [bacterium A37T11]|nr:Thiol-disulfide isomerase or thioredoxin [bacterium A37T11]